MVVGARCAGAATAMLLARAGARVLVVERDAAGIGHALDPRADARRRDAARPLGRCCRAIVAAGTPPVRRTTLPLRRRGRSTSTSAPAHGVDALYAPRRTVLDPVLVAAARRGGRGGPLRHRRARGLLRERRRAGVAASRRSPPAASDRRSRPASSIGADGRRSTRRAAGRRRRPRSPCAHAAAAVYAYCRAASPTRGNRWHYAPRPERRGDPDQRRAALHLRLGAARPLPRRDARRPRGRARAAARRGEPRARRRGRGRPPPSRGRSASPGEPGYLRRSHGPGWALVGDAGYFKDPITAHGITDALRDAEILARAVLEGGAAALARYQETRDALSLPLLRVTDAIAALDWDLPRCRRCTCELNAAMKAEQDWLACAWPALPKAA